MKMSYLLGALLLFSAQSFASTLVCTGDYFGYDFLINGKINGQTLSAVVLTVSSGGSVIKNEPMTLDSGRYVAGQSMQFVGHGADGTGTLDATYDGSSGNYVGTLSAQTSFGDLDISSTCSVH